MMNYKTHNPSAGPLADRMRDQFTERQRRTAERLARSTAEDLRAASVLVAASIAFLLPFVAAPLCALLGAPLAAAYLFTAGLAIAGGVVVVGYFAAAVYLFFTVRSL